MLWPMNDIWAEVMFHFQEEGLKASVWFAMLSLPTSQDSVFQIKATRSAWVSE